MSLALVEAPRTMLVTQSDVISEQVSSSAATSTDGILYETTSTLGTPEQLVFSARRPELLLQGPTEWCVIPIQARATAAHLEEALC